MVRRNGSLAAIPSTVLQQELERRQRAAQRLVREHARLSTRLARLEARLREAGVEVPSVDRKGTVGVRKRPRGRPVGTRGPGRPPGIPTPPNAMSLSDALVKILTGKTMSVSEAAEAVRNIYHSKAANFRTMVNACLVNKKKFRRVARGKYTAL